MKSKVSNFSIGNGNYLVQAAVGLLSDCSTHGIKMSYLVWQASLDSPQDGIMTEELLERLYIELRIQGAVEPKVCWNHEVSGYMWLLYSCYLVVS